MICEKIFGAIDFFEDKLFKNDKIEVTLSYDDIDSFFLALIVNDGTLKRTYVEDDIEIVIDKNRFSCIKENRINKNYLTSIRLITLNYFAELSSGWKKDKTSEISKIFKRLKMQTFNKDCSEINCSYGSLSIIKSFYKLEGRIIIHQDLVEADTYLIGKKCVLNHFLNLLNLEVTSNNFY